MTADKIAYQAEVITNDNNPSNFYFGNSTKPFERRYKTNKKNLLKPVNIDTRGKGNEVSNIHMGFRVEQH